jgi:predicted nucleic acid-binding protein
MLRPARDDDDERVKDLRVRARILLDTLDERDDRIVIPSIVVAEYLAGVPLEQRRQSLAEIQDRFYCPPFDAVSAILAADLFVRRTELPEVERTKERVVIKADIQIVATAKTHGTSVLYSHDHRLRALAESVGIKAFDLPLRHPNMFVDRELREGN